MFLTIFIALLGLATVITFSIILAYTMNLLNIIWILIGVILCAIGVTGIFEELRWGD